VNWVHTAQDGCTWWAIVNTLINLWVP